MKTLLLVQDECAPDSLEYFDKKFLTIVGESRESFKKTAVKRTYLDDLIFEWSKNNFILHISGDFPFYSLSKVEIT
ncbi:MAG: hypothetical protein M0R03_17180 [Novosphingobium sp.]|nr:hypothetical protein [Novosphingobium sp.]